MARLGVSPVFKAYDSDGTVLASGTVETYITNTSTPKNSYTTAAEAGTATSFTLDTNGEAVRYFGVDVAYKLIIKDSSGTTVRTIDPYRPQSDLTTLAADMDVNGNSIISSSNGDIAITPNGTGDVILDGLKWPQADGTNGQALTTDGAAQLSWATVSTDMVNDVTPQLGGDLDANAFDIQFDDATGIRDDSDNEQLIFQKTASAVNHIEITNATAAGTPKIASAGGDTNIDLSLVAKGSGAVVISGLSYPTSDGAANQALLTDGAGTLSFGTPTFDVATQAEMESATSDTAVVTPGRLQYHPGACKGWTTFNMAAADQESHNVASIADNGAGDWTISWTTDLSSSNYAVLIANSGGAATTHYTSSQAAGTTQIIFATETSITNAYVAVFGDH